MRRVAIAFLKTPQNRGKLDGNGNKNAPQNLRVRLPNLQGWCNGSYTMATQPIKFLELHYTIIQFLITRDNLPATNNVRTTRLRRSRNLPFQSYRKLKISQAEKYPDSREKSFTLQNSNDSKVFGFKVRTLDSGLKIEALLGVLGIRDNQQNNFRDKG